MWERGLRDELLLFTRRPINRPQSLSLVDRFSIPLPSDSTSSTVSRMPTLRSSVRPWPASSACRGPSTNWELTLTKRSGDSFLMWVIKLWKIRRKICWHIMWLLVFLKIFMSTSDENLLAVSTAMLCNVLLDFSPLKEVKNDYLM